MTLNLKKKKKPGGAKRKKAQEQVPEANRMTQLHHDELIEDEEMDEEDRAEEARLKAEEAIRANLQQAKQAVASVPSRKEPLHLTEEDSVDDPEKTIPMARYNPMLAIMKNTLYMLSVRVARPYILQKLARCPYCPDAFDMFILVMEGSLNLEIENTLCNPSIRWLWTSWIDIFVYEKMISRNMNGTRSQKVVKATRMTRMKMKVTRMRVRVVRVKVKQNNKNKISLRLKWTVKWK